MSKELIDIRLEGKGLDELVSEVETIFRDIPMGNTKFQIENFILNSSITPERKYRTIGLELNCKLRELQNMKLSIAKINIDIEELEFLINEEQNPFKERRLCVDLESKKLQLKSFDKTAIDMIEELKVYYEHFKKLPTLTRIQFEEAEESYFKERLYKEAIGMVGAISSLNEIGYTVNARTGKLEDLQKLVGKN